MFNERQLLGLEKSCQLVYSIEDKRVRWALATNLSDLLRYQNMLCRYDTMALKSLDIFSVHGFPVGLVQCESNLIGIRNGAGANVGSGGWKNITDKYFKAKEFCEQPFEIRSSGNNKCVVPIAGERIGAAMNGNRQRKVSIYCKSSTSIDLPPASLDAVFTDPPYFGNVQYGELMDFCYVWLRRLVKPEACGFQANSTRSTEELTGNITQSRGLRHFTEGLSAVYTRVASALKEGAPLVFTFHHNRIEAYYAIAVAILDAGLTCSSTIPCPAEMGGSIHIHGTNSSVIDTVFVCRAHGKVRRRYLCEQAADLIDLIGEEIIELRSAGVRVTVGDIRCIAFGHLARLAVWHLRKSWSQRASVPERLKSIAQAISALGDPEALAIAVSENHFSVSRRSRSSHYPIQNTSKLWDLHEADPSEWERI
jgi:adenine-specific DNA methylase